jgi:hypothetical protein
MPTLNTPVLSPERLATAYSYGAYRQLIDDLLATDKTTGPIQSAELVHYTRLNEQRMHRLDKTVHLLPELAEAMRQLPHRYTWLIITEGWCGDAAQLVPVFEAAAEASQGQVTTRYLLRDENLDLIDRYLTNGSRAIPQLVVLHADTLAEATHWGPRPAIAQELVLKLKAEGLSHEDFILQLHTWYAHDKTQTTQRELLALMQQLS